MKIIQRTGGRSIRIQDNKVVVDGKEITPVEAEKIREEGFAKFREALKHARAGSPQKGDSVVVVKTTGSRDL